MAYTLSPVDIAAFRQGDRIVVAFNESNESYRKTSVRIIKEATKTDRNPFAEEQVHTLDDCPVRIYGSDHSQPITASDAAARLVAFAMVSLFHSQHTPESSIVHQLRAGDQIDFQFHPDLHTNGYVAAAGLHADVLILHVWRGEGSRRKHFEFEIETGIGPNNSARMIRGLVESDHYRRDGARCRRETWTPPAQIAMPADCTA